MAELTLRADASEAEIDDLWERLKAFSDADRRETLSAWAKQVSGVSKVSSSTVSSEGSMASTVIGPVRLVLVPVLQVLV